MAIDIKKHKEALVLDCFLTNKNNSVPEIAAYLEMQEVRVNQIINKYIDHKKVNMQRRHEKQTI